MIPPLESEAEARALPAVRAIYEANREGRAALAEGNAAALRVALTGIDLGAWEDHLVGWFAGWEPHVIAGAMCRWLEEAREEGRRQGREEAGRG